jgi:hypothetical protein
LPDIEASIWKKYRDQGVLVYGLHPGDDPKLLTDFVAQTGITFPVVHSQGTLSQFQFPPGVGYPYPRDVVIGKDRRVRTIRNSFDADEMEALIAQLLAE